MICIPILNTAPNPHFEKGGDVAIRVYYQFIVKANVCNPFHCTLVFSPNWLVPELYPPSKDTCYSLYVTPQPLFQLLPCLSM